MTRTAQITISGRGYEPWQAGDAAHLLMLNNSDPVPLGGRFPMALGLLVYYRIIDDPEEPGTWRVQPAGYYYWLEDGGGAEYIAYHWHPEARGDAVPYPHLHIGPATGANQRGPFHHKVHVPTERVTPEQLLRLALTQLGVEGQRPDWERVLARTEQAFAKTRGW